MSWDLKKLEWWCGQPDINATETIGLAVKLSTFIDNCPDDFLETLMNSPFGRVYNLFLERCCKTSPTTIETIRYRDELSTRLRMTGFTSNEGQRLLLAIMPFYPNGTMSVEDAISKLPKWLHTIYFNRYEGNTKEEQATDKINEESEKPGFNNRIFLNRMLGLSNLYYIDPEDKEIIEELRETRIQCIELLLSCSSTELGQQFNGDFGDRFWAMAQSGIQKESLNSKESNIRQEVQNWLTNTADSLNTEGGIQRFASALLFSVPGSVQLSSPEQNLPTWFIEGFKRYSSMSAS